jgi:hypothetical protein
VQAGDDGFLAGVDVVEERVAGLGEGDDTIQVAGFDVLDEKPDVGARDERLAGACDDDSLHARIGAAALKAA